MKKITVLIISLLSFIQIDVAQTISDYRLYCGRAEVKGTSEEVIVLRRFIKDGHTYYLSVSPKTLKTSILNSTSLHLVRASWQEVQSEFRLSAYVRALEQAAKHDLPLQDAGITSFTRSQKGIDLTIDLCPSRRPLDRVVFTDLITELGNVEKPVPLAISITGRWMLAHPIDLIWLDSLQKAGILDITWINHTFNHFVSKNSPLSENFMLEPGTDINSEVFRTEVALLEHGLLPSVFFRFPGLVSDKSVYDKILSFGLIPVGTDAWLAKGQEPGNGSIVLIHANGNEPVGIKDFIELLRQHQQEVLSKKWELFDLRESVIENEKQ